MVEYLNEEEIIEINRLCLELSDEFEEFVVIQQDDIRFILKFVSKNFSDSLYEKSLAYCISLIALHPFKNGNHRTSLIAAEHFLLKNDFLSMDTDEKDLKMQKWRIEYEAKNDLEKEFFRITCIENEGKKSEEIKNVMGSKYGKTIEKWLKDNFIKN